MIKKQRQCREYNIQCFWLIAEALELRSLSLFNTVHKSVVNVGQRFYTPRTRSLIRSSNP